MERRRASLKISGATSPTVRMPARTRLPSSTVRSGHARCRVRLPTRATHPQPTRPLGQRALPLQACSQRAAATSLWCPFATGTRRGTCRRRRTDSRRRSAPRAWMPSRSTGARATASRELPGILLAGDGRVLHIGHRSGAAGTHAVRRDSDLLVDARGQGRVVRIRMGLDSGSGPRSQHRRQRDWAASASHGDPGNRGRVALRPVRGELLAIRSEGRHTRDLRRDAASGLYTATSASATVRG